MTRTNLAERLRAAASFCAAIVMASLASAQGSVEDFYRGRNEIGTSELDPFRSSILGPWSPL